MTQHQPVNWRALCEELVLEWDTNGCDWKPQYQAHWNATIERARAVLAQPEPEDDVALLRAALEATAAQRRAEDDARLALARPEPEVVVPDSERNWDSILSPSGGYEMADDAALRDGAQLVNGEWWEPVFGCDSLESALARIRERLKRQAVLAQPEPEVVGPTDEEVEAWADDQGFIKGHGDHPCGFWIDDGDAGAFARAVLARYGRPAPAPAGEVAEFVEWLHEKATWHQADEPEATLFDRAADLLERQAAPVPVAVSERLPGPEDCDAEGMCWWYAKRYGWEMQHHKHPRSDRWTHWLPAHALPIPSGEVEA